MVLSATWVGYLLGHQDMLMTSYCLHLAWIQYYLQYVSSMLTNFMLFNGKKNLLIIYKCTWSQAPDPGIVINNVMVCRVILLGHYMCEDIYIFNASKFVSDFNRQSKMCFANFRNTNSYIRNVMFHKNCTTF